MSAAQGDPQEWKAHDRGRDEEEQLLDRFRDPTDPLQFLIVTHCCPRRVSLPV
jgi:type I restriction enzyme R subunit